MDNLDRHILDLLRQNARASYGDIGLTVGLSPETSLLTGPDTASMAEGFRRMCDSALLGRLAAATPALLPSLSADRMAEKYLSVYRSVIEGNNVG